MRQFFMLILAVIVIAVVGAGVFWAAGTETIAASGLVTKVLGPSGQSFVFKGAVAGEDGPAKACVVCHSVEANGPLRVAPGLWGIVGAKKARAGWYAYSVALAEAGGSWSEEDLHKYLTNPGGFLPGTKKTIVGIADDDRRGRIIDYLKTLN